MARVTKSSAGIYFRYVIIMALLAFMTYTLPSVQAAIYGY
jgi:hypothetical protein